MMRVVVVGCGRVGSGLAYRLEMEGHRVTVVDRDRTAFRRLGAGFHGESVLGRALDRDLLEEVGIESADALAAVTGSDETNAVLARLAVHRFRVPRVIARLYEPRQADLYRRLGVSTVSPVAWSTARIADLLSLRDVAPITALGSGQVELLEAPLPPGMAGRQAGELEISGETRLVAVTRSGRTFLADAGTTLEAGDVVTVAVTTGSAVRLQQLLGLG
jgi:trk system potassium uptake protein TrkA